MSSPPATLTRGMRKLFNTFPISPKLNSASSSVMKTVNWRANDPELRWLSHFDWASSLYQPMLRKFWDCFFYGDFENRGKERFNEYYAELREIVPKEKLFEYKIGSGWKPLCEFLGQETPKVPFPKSNDTDGFVNRCRARNRAQMKNVAFRYMIAGGAMVATALSAAMAFQQFVPANMSPLMEIVSQAA